MKRKKLSKKAKEKRANGKADNIKSVEDIMSLFAANAAHYRETNRRVASQQGAGKPKGASVFEPTPDDRLKVMISAAAGIKNEIIRQWIINPATGAAINEKTFYKYFKEEIESGSAMLEVELFNKMIWRAMYEKGVPGFQAGKFILQAKFNWKETVGHDHQGRVEFAGAKERLETLLTNKFGKIQETEDEVPEVTH